MKFEKRTTSPSATNKYYLKAGKGGYNRAMEINSKTHSCIPNCCGEVHGRWLESQKQTDYNKYDKLCTGNAKSYYGKTSDGYKRGQTPKIGAIGCYSGGSSGCGHVLFVEEVYSNGDFLSSNSGYNGSRFFTKKITKSSGYSFGDKYKLQGFIYPPVDFTLTDVTSVVKRDESKNQIKVITTQLRVRKQHNTTSEILGVAQNGGIYNYYELYKDSKYTWYRIADNQWVANNGKWLEIYPKKESENKEMEELKKQLENANAQINQLNAKVEELNLINSNLNQENEKLVNDLEKFKKVYTCTEDGNYNIKIKLYKGESLYIK